LAAPDLDLIKQVEQAGRYSDAYSMPDTASVIATTGIVAVWIRYAKTGGELG
jgi:hypothetical protein